MLLSLAGSTVKGRALFLQAGRTLCISCHRVQGSGKNIGPDLSQVGGRLNREQLLESLLEPAKTITKGYSLYSLEMKSGEIQTGFLLERAKENTRFRLLSGEELTIPTQSVLRFTSPPDLCHAGWPFAKSRPTGSRRSPSLFGIIEVKAKKTSFG